MTDLDTLIRTLSAAHAASSAGEWHVDHDDRNCVRSYTPMFNTHVFVGKMATYDDLRSEGVDNAAFIAAAHQHLPALLAALTDARARLATAETLARAVSDSGAGIDACAEECVHCGNPTETVVGTNQVFVQHAPNCPVTLARALLAAMEGEGRHADG